jgi:mRNA interferase MazF
MIWQRGDVVLCRVPMPSTQLKQFKIPPAVIVSADRLNQVLDDVMVIPCTSNTNRRNSPNGSISPKISNR